MATGNVTGNLTLPPSLLVPPVASVQVLWYVYVAMRVIQGLVAMAVNSLTLGVLVTTPTLHRPPHLLIANLALADFLHGLGPAVLLPLRLTISHWSVWRVMCLLQHGLESISTQAEYTAIFMVSIERWMTLRAQLGMRALPWSCGFTKGAMVFMWMSLVVLVVLRFTHIERLELGKPCHISYMSIFTYISTALFLLSIIFTLVFYSLIARIAWRSRKWRQQVHPQPGTSLSPSSFPSSSQVPQTGGSTTAVEPKEASLARMLALVIGGFFVFYLPLVIVTFTLTPTSAPWHRFTFYACVVLFDINFWINPLIYAWRNKHFRAGFQRLLGRRNQGILPENIPM